MYVCSYSRCSESFGQKLNTRPLAYSSHATKVITVTSTPQFMSLTSPHRSHTIAGLHKNMLTTFRIMRSDSV